MKIRSAFSLICLLLSIAPAWGADPAPSPVPALSLLPAAAETVKKEAEQQKAKTVLNLGFVDMARVSSESTIGKKSQAKAKEKKDKLQAKIDGKRKQLDKQRAAIEAKLPKMTQTEKETELKKFQKKVTEFQTAAQQSDKELMAFQEELGEAFSTAVEKAGAEFGASSGISLIIMRRDLLYIASGVEARDVTDDIIKAMEGNKPK